MDMGVWLAEIFNRAGLTGVMAIPEMMHTQVEWGRGPLGFFAAAGGPTTEWLARLIQEGPSKAVESRLPVYGAI